MDDKTQKERLEQELRFLKESFEAEVISKEEFEKGKERIEKKLKEIQHLVNEKSSEESKITEKKEEEKRKIDEAIEAREGEKIKLRVITEEAEKNEQDQIQKIEKKEIAPEPKAEITEQKDEGKFFRYAVVFVVLALVIFFSYSLLKSDKATKEKSDVRFTAACSSDKDCKQDGKEGTCLEHGTRNAKCEFKEAKTNVVVLNDKKDCFNCDTQRVLSILENWFGPIEAKEIDFNTNEGKNLAEIANARALPVYILNENITRKPAFEQFKQAFVKKSNVYVLSEDAAGSTFYFKNDNIPDKLDLFVIIGDSAGIKAENNLKEFLDAFKEAKFEKHLSNDKIAQELGIRTFPAFLVNNRVKFSGIQTADAIKNNFCKLNKMAACEKNLSRNLI